jgi:hypothetical protein
MRNILTVLSIVFISLPIFAKPVLSLESRISKMQPALTKSQVRKISIAILKSSKKYNINPNIFVAIIMQESSFDQSKVSISGDISIAQINYEVWVKEFKRKKLPLLNKHLLKSDINYAIDTMGIILGSLKQRYSSREKYWFSRYHSSNVKRRIIYTNLLAKYSPSFNNY